MSATGIMETNLPNRVLPRRPESDQRKLREQEQMHVATNCRALPHMYLQGEAPDACTAADSASDVAFDTFPS